MIRRDRSSVRCGTALLVGLALAGCGDAESIFTEGRIEQRCNEAIPICNSQASCVLQDDQFLRDDFPGGKVFMIQTQSEETTVFARFLLLEPRASGTELFVRVHTDACGSYEEGRTTDRDLIEFAGDDSIIEYELFIEGRGDHLVEIFSDMSSDFLFRFDPE
ncbi:MAG: hypothetical protein OXR73_19210 [Myxococcales bacterium]|nr:hypothetical protein [Myxococcales bacterium]